MSPYRQVLWGERELQLKCLHAVLTARQFLGAALLGSLHVREFALLPRVILLQLLETLHRDGEQSWLSTLNNLPVKLLDFPGGVKSVTHRFYFSLQIQLIPNIFDTVLYMCGILKTILFSLVNFQKYYLIFNYYVIIGEPTWFEKRFSCWSVEKRFRLKEVSLKRHSGW